MDWLLGPIPNARVARLRVLVYGFIFVDLLVLRPWVADHASVSPDLYHPLFIAELLPFPVPTPLIAAVVRYSLLALAAVAMLGRLPRVAGWAVFVLYLYWMLIAFSYGKVDHDRLAFLVALAVLPAVGRASWNDDRKGADAGWAIHCIQLAVVATYFLASIAKFRYGGFDWVNGATLTRAVLRRGSFLADPLLDRHAILQMSQYVIVGFELLSPVMLLRNVVGRVAVYAAFAFHAMVFATITIMFWPHLVCLFSFLPLERLGASEPERGSRRFKMPARLEEARS